MNEVERANREVLIALVIDYHRSPNDIPDLSDLKEAFHLKMPEFLLDSSIEPWEAQDWLIVSRTSDGTAARIRAARYSAAHSRVLEYLGATSLQIDWQKEEILSDAAADDFVPFPNGWKWLTFEDEVDAPSQIGSPPPLATSHDSSAWTGLPKGFQLTDDKRAELIHLLHSAEGSLDALTVSNSEKAQARAFVTAARNLADAPDPPADLIWEIVNRANYLSGIASLFVAIIALFAS